MYHSDIQFVGSAVTLVRRVLVTQQQALSREAYGTGSAIKGNIKRSW